MGNTPVVGKSDYGEHTDKRGNCGKGHIQRFYGTSGEHSIDKLCAECSDGTTLACWGNKTLPDNFSYEGPFRSIGGRSKDFMHRFMNSGGTSGTSGDEWTAACTGSTSSGDFVIYGYHDVRYSDDHMGQIGFICANPRSAEGLPLTTPENAKNTFGMKIEKRGMSKKTIIIILIVIAAIIIAVIVARSEDKPNDEPPPSRQSSFNA